MANRRNVYFFYRNNDELNAKVDNLITLTEKNGFHIVNSIHDASFIVSIGGDGTFLQAVRKNQFLDNCLYAACNNMNSQHVL
ncbi:hypothetical protein [Metabacillus sp. RGM 3146]|uniref:hypothetical protein n=1 Tax=Metabacillus sp. RGM 3146 TaxID=3401092 RepID=UPI003B9908FA